MLSLLNLSNIDFSTLQSLIESYTNKSNKSKTRYNNEKRKHIEKVDVFVQEETILVKNQFKKSAFGEKMSEFQVKESESEL